MSPRALVVLVLISTLLLPTVRPSHADSLALTQDQLARLDQGEVIVMDVLPPGGSGGPGQGGTAIARVKAPPESVWRVLVDYPDHRGLYPRVVGAQVLESDAAHTLVHYIVRVGPFVFGFDVDNYADLGRWRLEWRLAKGRANGLFRDNWGYWQIEPRGNDAILIYSIAARTALPAVLTRGAERDAVIATLNAVRQRAEQEG